MAVAPKTSKRKGDDIPAPATKAVKKTKIQSPNASKTKIVKESPTTVVVTHVEKKGSKSAKSPKVSKAASTPAAADDASTAAPAVKAAKQNGISKKSEKAAPTTNVNTSAKAAVGAKKATKKAAPVPVEVEPQEITLGSEFDSESDDEAGDKVADQAAALLAGFESDSDDASDIDEGIPLDKIPAAPVSSESKKQLATAQKKKGAQDGPGTIYIGRVPHGFFGPQMRAYFAQFGTITKLRLSRNKRTGRSKHYAFVEFDSASVADIVARTMNKYLLFNHILQVKVMNQETLPEGLWEGANKRFKIIPRAKMEGRSLKTPKTKGKWELKEKKEQKRREGLRKKLGESMGYEFEMPDIKSARDLELVRPAPAVEGALSGAEDGAVKAIEAAPVQEEKPVEPVPTPAPEAKKGKKSKKTAVSTEKVVAPEVLLEKLEEVVADNAIPAVVAKPAKKTVGKKRAAPVDEAVKPVETPEKGAKKSKTRAVEVPVKKTRKSKG